MIAKLKRRRYVIAGSTCGSKPRSLHRAGISCRQRFAIPQRQGDAGDRGRCGRILATGQARQCGSPRMRISTAVSARHFWRPTKPPHAASWTTGSRRRPAHWRCCCCWISFRATRSAARRGCTRPIAAARRIAAAAVDAGRDQQVARHLRTFFYLPFAHSEDLADQDRSVALCHHLGPPDSEHSERHRDVIRRFGRFPHRNPILGRTMTPEEQEFLDQGGYAG